MRLDVYLFESGFTSSRTEAKRIIAEGKVKVDGLVISKPSFEVAERSRVDLDECSNKYVSRGGFKLEGALDAFNIAVTGKKAVSAPEVKRQDSIFMNVPIIFSAKYPAWAVS